MACRKAVPLCRYDYCFEKEKRLMKIITQNPRIDVIPSMGMCVIYHENGRRYRWRIPIEYQKNPRSHKAYADQVIAKLHNKGAIPTVKQWFTIEIPRLKKESWAAGTIRQTERAFERYCQHIANRALDMVGADDWGRVALSIQAEKDMTAASRNNMRGRIISAIKFAREKYPNILPPFDVLATQEKNVQKRREAYTDEEYQKLLDSCLNDEERLMIQLGGRLGLRKSELCLITKDNLVRQDDAWILEIREHFVNAKSGGISKIEPGRKANPGVHRITIPDDLADLIMKQETPIRYDRSTHMMEMLTMRAFGKRKAELHRLRHYAGTKLVEKLGVENAAKILGHKALDSTMIYHHITNDKAKSIAAKL
jgi:integrase